MSSISRDEVAHLANLSRLALTDEELDAFAGQLDTILGYVRTVSDVPTDDVPPSAGPHSVVNVARPDTVIPGVDRQVVLEEAPASEQDRFAVPRILGEEQ